jgi:hypothetical protein
LFLANRSTYRDFFDDIQLRCADEYAADLATYGLAEIDVGSRGYQSITTDIAYEGLLLLEDLREGYDGTNSTEVCTALAKIWHLFVEALHGSCGLPTVQELVGVVRVESDAEQDVVTNADLSERMSNEDRARLVGLVG